MLISFLAIQTINLPFKNIKSLYENTNFQVALMPGSAMEDAFKYSNDILYKNVYADRIQPYIPQYLPYVDKIHTIPLKYPHIALYHVSLSVK